MKKTILTDVDGVLLNWEYAFDIYMTEHGFKKQEGEEFVYGMEIRYGIERQQVTLGSILKYRQPCLDCIRFGLRCGVSRIQPGEPRVFVRRGRCNCTSHCWQKTHQEQMPSMPRAITLRSIFFWHRCLLALPCNAVRDDLFDDQCFIV